MHPRSEFTQLLCNSFGDTESTECYPWILYVHVDNDIGVSTTNKAYLFMHWRSCHCMQTVTTTILHHISSHIRPDIITAPLATDQHNSIIILVFLPQRRGREFCNPLFLSCAHLHPTQSRPIQQQAGTSPEAELLSPNIKLRTGPCDFTAPKQASWCPGSLGAVAIIEAHIPPQNPFTQYPLHHFGLQGPASRSRSPIRPFPALLRRIACPSSLIPSLNWTTAAPPVLPLPLPLAWAPSQNSPVIR
ncbi:hypothetical protein BGZ63DRAFT_220166 [Mariannaea sp. PMI_226]|nr:hypothetical protein BGZ63DRAFT_220166 [Mariannaea sp. PMI_226]